METLTINGHPVKIHYDSDADKIVLQTKEAYKLGSPMSMGKTLTEATINMKLAMKFLDRADELAKKLFKI